MTLRVSLGCHLGFIEAFCQSFIQSLVRVSCSVFVPVSFRICVGVHLYFSICVLFPLWLH